MSISSVCYHVTLQGTDDLAILEYLCSGRELLDQLSAEQRRCRVATHHRGSGRGKGPKYIGGRGGGHGPDHVGGGHCPQDIGSRGQSPEDTGGCGGGHSSKNVGSCGGGYGSKDVGGCGGGHGPYQVGGGHRPEDITGGDGHGSENVGGVVDGDRPKNVGVDRDGLDGVGANDGGQGVDCADAVTHGDDSAVSGNRGDRGRGGDGRHRTFIHSEGYRSGLAVVSDPGIKSVVPVGRVLDVPDTSVRIRHRVGSLDHVSIPCLLSRLQISGARIVHGVTITVVGVSSHDLVHDRHGPHHGGFRVNRMDHLGPGHRANHGRLDGADDGVVRMGDAVHHGLGDGGGPEESGRVGHRPDGGGQGLRGDGAHQAVRRGLVSDGGVRVRDGGGQRPHALDAGRDGAHVQLAGRNGDGVHLGDDLRGGGCRRRRCPAK